MKIFDIFKRRPAPPRKWREFITYVDPFMRHSQIAGILLQKANSLGLEGKRIAVVIRTNSADAQHDEIWFEGEMK